MLKSFQDKIKKAVIGILIFIGLFFLKLLLDGYLNPFQRTDPELLKSIGTFLSGTLGPIITGCSIYFLALNYLESIKRRISDENRHHNDIKLKIWQYNFNYLLEQFSKRMKEEEEKLYLMFHHNGYEQGKKLNLDQYKYVDIYSLIQQFYRNEVQFNDHCAKLVKNMFERIIIKYGQVIYSLECYPNIRNEAYVNLENSLLITIPESFITAIIVFYNNNEKKLTNPYFEITKRFTFKNSDQSVL